LVRAEFALEFADSDFKGEASLRAGFSGKEAFLRDFHLG
jgi:hypothetical protein